jgi:VIT1/CCC1 family predicted Fe2+/Mn2+ transporter
MLPEKHFINRVGWLRASVLGANDGILSTASLILGVASAAGSHGSILIAGISGLVAGAMSMAAGEFVSVSSQADSEEADIARERKELAADKVGETDELTKIYIARGLDENLARQVSQQLMAKDALAAHTRDELGISDTMSARPVQAALTSAVSFATGAALPLATVVIVPKAMLSTRGEITAPGYAGGVGEMV